LGQTILRFEIRFSNRDEGDKWDVEGMVSMKAARAISHRGALRSFNNSPFAKLPPSHEASSFAQGYGGQDGGQARPKGQAGCHLTNIQW